MIKSIQDLTDLELRIAVMGMNGYSTNEIAECLQISTYKVKKVKSSINKKCEQSEFYKSLAELISHNII